MAQTKEKELGQQRPSVTTDVILVRKTRGNLMLKKIFVTNVTSRKVKFRLYHNENGTVFSLDDAIVYDMELNKGQIFEDILDIPMNNSSGAFGVRSNTANGINFKIFDERS